MKLDSLESVLLHELNDLYSAEDQLVAALPKMARAASNDQLRQAFEHHLEETRGHRDRIQEIFAQLGKRRSGGECKAMKGLVAEGQEIIATDGDAAAKDAALIAAAQRVEHYEIAAYGTARTLAGELDLPEAGDLLEQTLDEESNADTLLTKIATGGMLRTGVNQKAAG